ncbi:hypothetical protein [Methylobacterium sp. CCH5-D2]|uniref:deoxynucleotide monophosphate kinase family protein n=1 Tax=Methylobacterium sp. CCH5-D2 TaxID=1768765 RepID=UPI00082BCB59|nr:hypothetical protein [Methylobacterium sp. CCH5-D2]
MIIGLTAPAGAGKSLAAAYLAERHGFARVRFADPLKAMLRAFYVLLDLSDTEIDRRIEGDLKEAPDPDLCGRTPRRAMQTLGSDWARDLIGRDLWTRSWANRSDLALISGRSVVAEDVRYANEAETMRARGGIVVRIVRPDAESARPGAAGHASEAMDFPADITIRNDGTPEVLFARLDGVIRRFALPRAA